MGATVQSGGLLWFDVTRLVEWPMQSRCGRSMLTDASGLSTTQGTRLMRESHRGLLLSCLLIVSAGPAVWSADAPNWTRTQDVIYGRKYGLALTMDVFTPKKARGIGVIFVVSGGWFSRPEAIQP